MVVDQRLVCDWYSSHRNRVGAGAHIFEIFVPEGCPIGIDLQSPEYDSHSATGIQPFDENFGGFNNMPPTRFELFAGISRPDPEVPKTLGVGLMRV